MLSATAPGRFGSFVIWRPLFVRLDWDAPVVENRQLIPTFGRIPGTRNPGVVPGEEFLRLLEVVGVRVAPGP